MKKYFSIFLAAFALLAFFAACQKDSVSVKETDSETETSVTPEKNPVTIVASIPQEGITKVSLTPQEEVVDGLTTRTVKLEWEVGDIITVNGIEFAIDYETLSPDKKSANFHSDDTPEAVDGKYTIAYSKEPAGGFANQEQEEDGDYSHLGYSVTLSNVTDYSNITFSSGWAESNSATFSQSSVLWLRALLPAAVAGNVEKVIFKASQNVFNGTNTFTVSLNTPGVQGGDNKLDVYATIPSGAVTSGAMDLLVQFQVSANDYDKYTAYRQIPDGSDFGASQYIGINCSNIESYANASATGIGTSSNPYLIGDQHQMQAITLSSTKQYYRLVDDIDMTDVSWTSLNASGTNIIDLKGNGNKISNLTKPLFDDFNGNAENFTIYNAVIDHSTDTTPIGIFACTVNNAASTVNNVDISNCSLTATKAYSGGFIGQTAADINLSYVDVISTNIEGGLTGGIIGFITKTGTVSHCSFDGGVLLANNQYTGGLVAATTAGQAATISDCNIRNATLRSAYHKLGGAVGHLRSGSTIERTNVGEEGTNVTITASGTEARYTGGLVGYLEGGTIRDNCNTYVTLTGVKTEIGGFVGYMNGGTVTGGKSHGTVTGPGTIGGFFGLVNAATSITNNASYCAVSATTTYVGGFAGRLAGSVSCSGCFHRDGKVSSNIGGSSESFVGGFAGYIGNKGESFTGTITSCYVREAEVESIKYKSGTTTPDSSGGWVGGFAGGIGSSTYASNTGVIQKCYVHASQKSGGQYTGGFAGVSYSSIEKCRVSGTFVVQGYAASLGGFVGYQQGNHIKYCYTNAKPSHSGKSNVGGFAGQAKNTTIEECYSSGDISGTSTTTGGMIGYVSSATTTKLIRWNHSNNTNIIAGESSTPSDCYVKTASDSNFKTRATDLGWTTDGTIWSYPDDGGIPTLVGV